MNNIPKAIRPLAVSAKKALLGVKELDAPLNIKANDGATFAPVVYDAFGRAADPTATPPVEAIVGKHALYSEAKAEHANARTLLREALADGSEFVAKAVSLLKSELGRSWNSKWTALGFHTGSLRLPTNPVSVISQIAAYYRTHPGQEVAPIELTAAKADQLELAFDTAQTAAATARAAETTAKQVRDAAIAKVRLRMASLREELGTLLARDDARWYRFGFRRPVDGETPDLVEEVRLTPGVAGQVVVEWTRARLGESYRVSWQLASAAPEEEPTQVGIFADQLALVDGLPSGATITVFVTARNAAGESAPMEANIVVP